MVWVLCHSMLNLQFLTSWKLLSYLICLSIYRNKSLKFSCDIPHGSPFEQCIRHKPISWQWLRIERKQSRPDHIRSEPHRDESVDCFVLRKATRDHCGLIKKFFCRWIIYWLMSNFVPLGQLPSIHERCKTLELFIISLKAASSVEISRK